MNAASARVPVLAAPLDAIDELAALQRIVEWAQRGESRMICLVNAHSAVTAARSKGHAAVLAASDLNLADGAPVAWLMRRCGAMGQKRISGPDLMLRLTEVASRTGLPVYLLGGGDDTLVQLHHALQARWPELLIAGAFSPPFRRWDARDREQIEQSVAKSGARIVFVGLGCPKQESWMASQHGRLPAVLIGVGAAFDFHAGRLKRAPLWMQVSGLEWLHRLLQEPRRLGPRYLVTNTLFVAGALRQWAARARAARSR